MIKIENINVRGSSEETVKKPDGQFINAGGFIDRLKVEGRKQQRYDKGRVNTPSNEDLQTLCGWESKMSSK